MARIGIGVIGCGDIAHVRYLPSIAASPEARLIGVYSRRRAICETATRQFGGKAYHDLEALLSDSEVDAVIVATPHPSHAELAIRALDAGKHVLTEKPMATSLADADRVLEAASRTRNVLMALPLDSSPPVDEARRLIRTGAIGRVSGADAVLAHHGPLHAPWFFDAEQAGWGVLADLGIYLISQLTYLFGPAESAFAQVATMLPERTLPGGQSFRVGVEDSVAAVITLESKITATLRANWCSPADKRNFIWETRIYGTDGMIFINLAPPGNMLVLYSPGRPIEGAEPIVYNGMTECYRLSLSSWDLHMDVLTSFLQAIREGGPIAKNGASAARQHYVIEIIAKLYESSESGCVQRLVTPMEG